MQNFAHTPDFSDSHQTAYQSIPGLLSAIHLIVYLLVKNTCHWTTAESPSLVKFMKKHADKYYRISLHGN